MITALRDLYPEAEIHALTSAVGAEILKLHPDITKVHCYKVGSGLKALWQLSQQLKAENYILYISVWNHPEMAWVGRLAGIPLRIGDASNPSLRWLYTHPVRQNWGNMTMHWSSFNLSLLRPLLPAFSRLRREKEGIPKGYRPLESRENSGDSTESPGYTGKTAQPGYMGKNEQHVYPFQSDKYPPKYPTPVGVHGDEATEAKIALKIGSREHDPRLRVAIFVGTGGTNFPIPESAILRLVSRLTEAGQYRILLCGQAATPELMSLTQSNIINLIGKTSLPELIAWIRQSDIYVGPDTGPTQIASMMGKSIVFFSPVKPNPPAYWGPLSPAFRIIREEYRCERFCATEGCRSSCFDFLTGDRLYTEIQELEKQRSAHMLWSPAESATVRIRHTLRLLIVCHHPTEWETALQAKESFAKKGILVWTMYCRRPSFREAFQIIDVIKKRNINVIHAPFLPNRIMTMVRLVMGMWYKYPSPLWVKSGIMPDTSEKQLISMYRQLWS